MILAYAFVSLLVAGAPTTGQAMFSPDGRSWERSMEAASHRDGETTELVPTVIASVSSLEEHRDLKSPQSAPRERITRFALTFVPAFLSTGILLGVIYVLVMKAIGGNRQQVEVYLDNLRKRLQSGPVPVIEKAQPVMLGVLYAVYGRSASRRLSASFCIGLFFSCVVFGAMYFRYKHVSATVRETKARLERDAEPVLYDYFNNPGLRPVYNQSQQYVAIQAGNDTLFLPLHAGGIWDELRERKSQFHPRLVTLVFQNSNRTELALLFWFQGSYIDPGFQWIDASCVFAFNVFLDFISVTIIIVCLQRLGPSRRSFRRALSTFAVALAGTLICAAIAFLSYRLFFRGYTNFFTQILVVLPLSLLAAAIAFAALLWILAPVYQFIRKHTPSDDSPNNFVGMIILGSGSAISACAGLSYVWSYWHRASLGVINWRDLFSFPYILAATTLVPATLTLLAFALMLLAKVSAEPARVLPESYMTFMREEVGGTQAAGIILVLGVIAGVIFTLIWSPPP